ncbi:MAG: hypothetical protein NTV94_03460, partial [Planctomycetota bacterium]|nr:hypothetical protein [Planctomycetota bacterium]
MLPLIACVLAGVSLVAEPPTLGSVRQEITTAHRALRDPTQKARELGSDARIDEGNKLLLDTFPEATRTPAQAFCLGNLLFKLDPQAAYALHKQAAAGLPEVYPNPQLEWAMVQHRAGEYAGAAAAYRKYTKAKPNEAVPFGLLAECLIRTGDLAGAVEAWETSETAQDGTLTDLETQVCEVHTAESPLLKRSLLAKKVREGDAAAAAELLAFDLNFPRDWWNIG